MAGPFPPSPKRASVTGARDAAAIRVWRSGAIAGRLRGPARPGRAHGRRGPDARPHAHLRLPTRLSQRLRARDRAHRRPSRRSRPPRQGARLRAQSLYRRRDLRQGRALRRALPSPRPAGAAAAAGRPQGLGQLRADRLGRGARRGRRGVSLRDAAIWQRDGLALLLRRHHGPRAARRHQPPAPHAALLGLALDHLRHAVRRRLEGGPRQALGRDRRGDGALGPDRDLGHQPGEHAGQRDDPRRPGAQGARRQARGGRPLSLEHGGAGGHAPGAAPRHRRRARLRRHARAVPRRLRRSRLSRPLRRRRCRARGASRRAHARMGRPDHGPLRRDDRGLRPALRPDQALLSAARLRLHALAQRCRQHARRLLPAGGDRRLAARGRRGAV